MKPFVIPRLEEFGAMTPDDRLKALMPIAEFQAHRTARGNRVHLDEYKSAGWGGLWALCQDFNPKKYQDNGHFRSYCMRTARNAIIDERRRQVGRFVRGKWVNRGPLIADSRARVMDHRMIPHEETVPHESDDPAEALERAELPARVDSLLQLLSPREQKIMRMLYYQGMKQYEIAEIFGVSFTRISQIFRVAIRKLRTQ